MPTSKGPWRAVESHGSGDYLILDAGGRRIAWVYNRGDNGENAKLITSAPLWVELTDTTKDHEKGNEGGDQAEGG